MKIFLKKIRNAIFHIIKDNKKNKRSIWDNINTFLIFVIYSYSFFRPKSQKLKDDLEINSENLIIKEKFKIIYNQLNQDGHTNLMTLKENFSDNFLDEIVSNEENLYFEKDFGKNLYKQNEKIGNYLNRLKERNVNFLQFSTNSKISPSLKKILNDDFINKLVYLYLNTKKIYTRNQSFITFANSTDDHSVLKKTNQQYHIDMMSRKWLKMFIYFNDIDEDNGAHSFIKKSHISKKGEEYNLTNYFADSKIKELYQDNEIFTAKGKKNTCFLEDTYGLHKAGFISKGVRMVSSITFSASKNYFGHKNDEIIYLK